MAPPKKITRQQREILLNFLEGNKEYARGLPSSPAASVVVKGKWALVAKKLNSVSGGIIKSPDLWRRYWIEWRHKTVKKATDCRRTVSNNKLIPLNDLEIRVLEISGKMPTIKRELSIENIDEDHNLLNDSTEVVDSPNVLAGCMSSAAKPVFVSTTSPLLVNIKSDDLDAARDVQNETPPPKWAMELEQRRIGAEERIATALESIVSLMKRQEERHSILDERMSETLSSMASSVQHICDGMQEALQHLNHLHPKNNSFNQRHSEYLDDG